MEEIKQKEQELIDKLEKEKLVEETMYTIEIDYHKWNTTDKDVAFKLWQSLSESFYTLESIDNSIIDPCFYYRKPIKVKLIGEKKQIWKDHESAQRAANAFKALTERVAKKAVDNN